MRIFAMIFTVIFQVCSIGLAAQSRAAKSPADKQVPGSAIPGEKLDRDIDLASAKRPLPLASISHSYALVIGIAKYKNLPALAQLGFAARDADSMYSALTSPTEGNFPIQNVHKLTDEHATYANILHELEVWLPAVTTDSDRVLVFYSGHCIVKNSQTWITPYEVDIKEIPATAISTERLSNAMGGSIRGKWKILLTDAAHSGAIDPEGDRRQFSPALHGFNQSVFSLTASRDRETSYEDKRLGGGHGVFTYFILKALEGYADINGDGVVDADELSEFVHRNVRAATSGDQNPTSERGSYDPHMVIAYNPSRNSAIPSIEEDYTPRAGRQNFGSLVIGTDREETAVVLDGQGVGIARPKQALKLWHITPGGHLITGTHGDLSSEPNVVMVYHDETTPVSLHLIARPAGQALPVPKVSAVDNKISRFDPALRLKQKLGEPIRGYAVIIGISAYKNLPLSAQLEFPGRDADAIYAVLTDPDGGQFAPQNVHELIDDRATLSNIRHELEDWLPSVATPADRVLIYFAGHGIVREDSAYFAPFDVEIGNVAGTALSMASLGRTIDSKIKAKEKILITDACHAGALTPESSRKQLNEKLFDLTSSLYSLTASRDREVSLESADWGGGHGVFTYFVMKGLKGEADINSDGVVDADELSEYVHASVRLATNGRQNPSSDRASFDPKMVLSRDALRMEPGPPLDFPPAR